MDVRIGEMESKVRLQQQANQNLLRRVQMLEQALHDARSRRLAMMRAQGASPAARAAAAALPLLPETLPGRPALEARIRRRRAAPSAREILQAFLQEEVDK